MICMNCGRLKLRAEEKVDHIIPGYPFMAVIMKHICRPNKFASTRVDE